MTKENKTMFISLITNMFLVVVKVIFGILGKCNSLITDGIHSFSDLSTDLVAIIGNNLSNKKSDSKHPYGHGKVEYVTSVMIGIVILIVGGTLIINTFKKEIIVPNILMIYVSLFTIIAKLLLANYILAKGKLYKNNILIASATESRADVYSSVFVLISIVLMQFTRYVPILKYSDLVGALIISLFIVKTGYNILKENISILLEEQIVDEKLTAKLSKTILSFDNILEIKSLSLFKYGPYYRLVSEIIMDKNITLKEAHDTVDELEKKLKNKEIKYVFIHMEPNV